MWALLDTEPSTVVGSAAASEDGLSATLEPTALSPFENDKERDEEGEEEEPDDTDVSFPEVLPNDLAVGDVGDLAEPRLGEVDNIGE